MAYRRGLARRGILSNSTPHRSRKRLLLIPLILGNSTTPTPTPTPTRITAQHPMHPSIRPIHPPIRKRRKPKRRFRAFPAGAGEVAEPTITQTKSAEHERKKGQERSEPIEEQLILLRRVLSLALLLRASQTNGVPADST